MENNWTTTTVRTLTRLKCDGREMWVDLAEVEAFVDMGPMVMLHMKSGSSLAASCTWDNILAELKAGKP